MELIYKIWWGIILIFVILFCWSFWGAEKALASTIFETNFDSLTPGDLDGQDGWSSPIRPTATVTSTEFYSSPYSVYLGAGEMAKTGAKIYGVGSVSFRMFVSSVGATTQDLQVGLSGNSALNHSDAQIQVSCKDDSCATWGVELRACHSSGFNTVLGYVDLDTWHDYKIEFDAGTNKYRVKIDDEDFSGWGQCYSNSWTWIDVFWGHSWTSAIKVYIDDIYEELPSAGIEITSPETESEQAQTFNVEGTFDTMGGDWDRLMIFFEQWHASSTCPEYMSDDWLAEWDAGMFYNQSNPFFSDFFNASTTGNFLITVDDIRTGNYNCSRCYFINESTGEFSEQLCQGYTLEITDIAPSTPTFYLPFLPWTDYYATSSDTFATSTALFESMAGALGPLVDKMAEFILYVKDYFDASKAMEKGTELGQAIPKARGYLVTIDDFINLPLSSFVTFYFLTLAVVISYKIILTVIKLFKP